MTPMSSFWMRFSLQPYKNPARMLQLQLPTCTPSRRALPGLPRDPLTVYKVIRWTANLVFECVRYCVLSELGFYVALRVRRLPLRLGYRRT